MSFRQTHQAESGFTMIEMMVTVLIASLLACLATYAFSDTILNLKQSEVKQSLHSDLAYLRTQAAKDGARGVFLVSSSGNSYTLGLDYLPYSSQATADTIFSSRQLPSRHTLTANSKIIFDPRGRVITVDGLLTDISIQASHDGSAYSSITAHALGYVTTAE